MSYSHRLEAERQVSMEEKIAATIYDKADVEVDEETAAQLGRELLLLVLEEFRSDLIEPESDPLVIHTQRYVTTTALFADCPELLEAFREWTASWDSGFTTPDDVDNALDELNVAKDYDDRVVRERLQRISNEVLIDLGA